MDIDGHTAAPQYSEKQPDYRTQLNNIWQKIRVTSILHVVPELKHTLACDGVENGYPAGSSLAIRDSRGERATRESNKIRSLPGKGCAIARHDGGWTTDDRGLAPEVLGLECHGLHSSLEYYLQLMIYILRLYKKQSLITAIVFLSYIKISF